MSFRRRGDVISGSSRTPQLRGAPALLKSSNVVSKDRQREKERERDNEKVSAAYTKTSLINSNLKCTSTGSFDIDNKILKHGGLTMGSSLLYLENGSTDFTNILIKRYISLSVVQNRDIRNSQILNHNLSIVIGLPMRSDYHLDLPDVYVSSSSKERKKRLVKENENKISVSNVVNNNGSGNKDLKIAWRYAHNKNVEENRKNTGINILQDDLDSGYLYDLDITKKIRPVPSNNEVVFIPFDNNNYEFIIKEVNKIIENEVKKDPSKNIRICLPYLLHPMVYGIDLQFDKIIQFFFNLKKILNKFKNNVTLISNLNSELFSNCKILEILKDLLFNNVIELQPFNQDLNNLMEKIYKTQRDKIMQGYINIFKIDYLSNIGIMNKQIMEYAFKNGKSKFHIEEWSIPVEEEDDDKNNNEIF